MNEEALGMIVGFIVVAPIAAFFAYRIIKKHAGGKQHTKE